MPSCAVAAPSDSADADGIVDREGGRMDRLRVGVVGTGVIAQVMHLHYLAELRDLFEVTAVCDIVGGNARACADPYAIPAAYADWGELTPPPIDPVPLLTPASPAPTPIAA